MQKTKLFLVTLKSGITIQLDRNAGAGERRTGPPDLITQKHTVLRVEWPLTMDDEQTPREGSRVPVKVTGFGGVSGVWDCGNGEWGGPFQVELKSDNVLARQAL